MKSRLELCKGKVMRSARFFKRALGSALFTLALVSRLPAQAPVLIDLGIRGGVVATDSFQFLNLCCGAGAFLGGSWSFSSEKLHGTIGPTVGVVLYDRVEVRFEAVHRRFGYQIQNALPFFGSQHTTDTVHGHLWQYPLLATYRPGYGPARPFIGGGLDLGGTRKFSTDHVITITPSPGGSPVTTFSSHTASHSTLSQAFYVIGGVDARISLVSIRPELRYIHFSGIPNFSSGADAVLKPNQFEFLIGIGISARPFRIR
jgi:hypothetical protein